MIKKVLQQPTTKNQAIKLINDADEYVVVSLKNDPEGARVASAIQGSELLEEALATLIITIKDFELLLTKALMLSLAQRQVQEMENQTIKEHAKKVKKEQVN